LTGFPPKNRFFSKYPKLFGFLEENENKNEERKKMVVIIAICVIFGATNALASALV